jgi:hypothetical protein
MCKTYICRRRLNSISAKSEDCGCVLHAHHWLIQDSIVCAVDGLVQWWSRNAYLKNMFVRVDSSRDGFAQKRPSVAATSSCRSISFQLWSSQRSEETRYMCSCTRIPSRVYPCLRRCQTMHWKRAHIFVISILLSKEENVHMAQSLVLFCSE